MAPAFGTVIATPERRGPTASAVARPVNKAPARRAVIATPRSGGPFASASGEQLRNERKDRSRKAETSWVRFTECISETSQCTLACHLHRMTPEKARWNGPGDRPAFGEARRFSIQGDANLVDIPWCAIPQHAPDESVNEFAERAMIEREGLRVQIRLAPVKGVFPDEVNGSQRRRWRDVVD